MEDRLLSPLLLAILFLATCASDDGHSTQTHQVSTAQCGEYSNQVLEDGMCRIMATLPQMDDQRCPDMFRCTDEVSYWLHENEERKQQILALRETVSELQEELRNHRHRVKVLELQSEEKNRNSSSIEQRLHELEDHYAEATTLLHIQGSLIYDLQAQIQNLSLLVEKVRRNPGCMINIVRTSPLLSAQEALHPEVQHVRNCPIDCASIYYNGVRRSGIYTVVPSLGAMPVEVYCDMDTDSGGWTVIQRRQDGSVNFDRSWKEYKEGFGDLHTEYWLGNEHIHDLTSQGDYMLRIDLEDWSGKHKHAVYQKFSVEDEATQYRVHVTGFSGTVEDSFSWYHDKQGFSTPDTGNICAEISHSGWWYNQCFYANLNGIYYKGGRYSPKGKNPLGPDGIVWYTWKDSDYYSLRKVSMMIRPKTFRQHLSP
ncbi:fibrinogen-like protein 1 [Pimephales promelas]|uniref:fibrinogen-like protein 1 n=1 Tax=Pimephales promelas TaxID=90988 RepID=UPI0019556714|nr:fibrinogen-like protein 1 [Pimephales promelas]XP_039547925.1 fibrinogen-like protein 1 [Pimephales promelas]KAG1963387.1 fibrinogen-like protein [Pimephales promelas]